LVKSGLNSDIFLGLGAGTLNTYYESFSYLDVL